MKTIAIANQKGGTGKTSLAVHLAVGMAQRGRPTLLVDLDPQQNATRWMLGRTFGEERMGAPSAMVTAALRDADVHAVPDRPNLALVPCTLSMEDAEHAVASKGGHTRLRRALHAVADTYEWCFVDCPPHIGAATRSGMCASTHVLAPILPAFLTVVGLGQLERTVAELREDGHADTRVCGHVLFCVDARESVGVRTRELLQEEAADRLFKCSIRKSTAAATMPEHGLTAWDAGADPRGLEDYRALRNEFMRRIE